MAPSRQASEQQTVQPLAADPSPEHDANASKGLRCVRAADGGGEPVGGDATNQRVDLVVG